jgi:uncharacterized lipoprotein YmbA
MRLFIVLVLLWQLAACSSAPAQLQRYTFSASATEMTDDPLSLVGGLGVGPVELPEFWRQREVVVIEDNRILTSDRHLWAGDPTLAISRVIAGNLSRQLHINDVWAHPWDSRTKPQKQIVLVIESFGGALGQEVELIAKWRLTDDFGLQAIATERQRFSSTPADRSYVAYVGALNQMIGQLSQALEQSVRQNFRDDR